MQSAKKSVLITGASRGIGRAAALEFAKRGYNLMLLARDEAALKDVAATINDSGGTANYFRCDVTSPDDMRNAVDYMLSVYPSIDIALLNSGVSLSGWLSEQQSENIRKTYEVNFFGVFNGIEALIPVMKAQGGGTIAGVSSLSDFRPLPRNSAYSSSKAAVSYLLDAARTELKPLGIRVIKIRPGFIQTDMTANHRFYMPFYMEVEKAARIIVNGIEKGKRRINFPLPMVLLVNFLSCLPDFVWDWVAKRVLNHLAKLYR